MGNFFQSAHIRTHDAAAARAALEVVAHELKFRCWAAPLAGHWLTFFPDHRGSIAAISRRLSQVLHGEVLLTLVHDSDVFSYCLCRAGAEEDDFASNPEYFSAASAAAKLRVRGAPEKITHLLEPPHTAAELAAWFAGRNDTAPELLMTEFMRLVGIATGASSYEYLERGEREGISRWSEFTHHPDLTAEKAAQKARRDEIRATKRGLLEQRVLVFDSTVGRTRKAWENLVLHGAHPAGGFLCSNYEGSMRLHHWQPPHPPQPLSFSPEHVLHFDSCRLPADNRTLVVHTDQGRFTLDLVTGTQAPFFTEVSGALIAADLTTDTGFFMDRETLTAVGLSDRRVKFTHRVGYHNRTYRLHPREPHLFWFGADELGILDKNTGAEIARFEVLNRFVRPKKIAQWRAKGHDATGFPGLDRDCILAWELTSDGEFLLTGTTEGLRVYRYADLAGAGRRMPDPIFAFETCVELQDNRFVNTVVWDPARQVAIFSSGDDSLRGLAWPAMQVRELSPALDQSRLFQLLLSGDQVVCRRRGYLNMPRREDEFSFQVWNIAALLARITPPLA